MALDQTSRSDLSPPVPDPRRYWALAIIAVAQLMIVLDASVVIVALPSAQRALHISVANRQWVMSAYTLAFGSLLLLGGRIADYLGRRRMFFIGLLGFAAASALGGLAQDPGHAVRCPRPARCLRRGDGARRPVAVDRDLHRGRSERARAFGVYGGIAGGGAAIGLVLGGTLTQFASWRWTLLINVPIAAHRRLRRDPGHQREQGEVRDGYDLPGAARSPPGCSCWSTGSRWPAPHGWGSPPPSGCWSVRWSCSSPS